MNGPISSHTPSPSPSSATNLLLVHLKSMSESTYHRDANVHADITLDYDSGESDILTSSTTPLELSAQSNIKHKELLKLFHILQFEFVPDLFKQRPCVEEMIRLMKKLARSWNFRQASRTDEDATEIADDTARLMELMDVFIISDAQPLPRSLLDLEYAFRLYERCCGLRDALEFEELVGCDAYRDTVKMCGALGTLLYIDYEEEDKLRKAMGDINDLGTFFFTSHDQYFGKIIRGEINI